MAPARAGAKASIIAADVGDPNKHRSPRPVYPVVGSYVEVGQRAAGRRAYKVPC